MFGLMSFLLLITTTGSTAWALEGSEFPYTAHGLFEECKVSAVLTKAEQEQTGTETFICKLHDSVPSKSTSNLQLHSGLEWFHEPGIEAVSGVSERTSEHRVNTDG